ncbi:hypothetical protein [Citricoccus sp. NR2]|uniref:hypothetical protein n=1 Tax=Citricoccus sp. NR2 TaxID=3004095 RepID=UPI0022DE23C0|nr:hypothetical protein [Citricoccus sp. NR2]WBL19229.1 hypothetical protein O1A05_00530 [Citricoccus sp. NR2]
MIRFAGLIASNAASSIVAMLLTIVIGRQGGPALLGVFSVCFAAMAFIDLFAREIGVNRALLHASNATIRQQAFSRALLVSLSVAVLVAGAGWVMSAPIVLAMSPVVPGYVCYNYLRLWAVSDGQIRKGLTADVVQLTLVCGGSAAAIVGNVPVVWVVLCWAAGLWLSAVMLAYQVRLRFIPRWPASEQGVATGTHFGVQVLIGNGSVHVMTFILAAVTHTAVLGAIRGASTVFGPINLISTSVSTLAIRQIADGKEEDRAKHMLYWFAVPTGLALLLVGAMLVLSVFFGELILGRSWDAVQPLLIWAGLDVIVVATMSAVHAVHRVDGRARELMRISVIGAVARLTVVPALAWSMGAQGAIIAILVVSIVVSLGTWMSYWGYRKQDQAQARSTQPREEGAADAGQR